MWNPVEEGALLSCCFNLALLFAIQVWIDTHFFFSHVFLEIEMLLALEVLFGSLIWCSVAQDVLQPNRIKPSRLPCIPLSRCSSSATLCGLLNLSFMPYSTEMDSDCSHQDEYESLFFLVVFAWCFLLAVLRELHRLLLLTAYCDHFCCFLEFFLVHSLHSIQYILLIAVTTDEFKGHLDAFWKVVSNQWLVPAS